MKLAVVGVCLLLVAPFRAPAASKEIQELQRDIALLQQQIKDLQSSQDKNFAAVTELARQAIEAANRANTSVAVVTSNMEKTLDALRTSTTSPLAAINSRLSETTNDVRELHQAVADQAATLTRMQQMLNDIKDLVKAAQTPAPPPPGAVGATLDTAPSNTKPAMSGSELYNSALSDMRGGKYDLAIQGFNDYLKWFPTETYAPNAQFYVGTLHYQAKNYDQAVTDFDNVLEHYTRNSKTDAAMLYKGRALLQISGRRTDGANTFKQLLKESPKSDEAKSACDELKNLGMNCTVPGASARPAGKRK